MSSMSIPFFSALKSSSAAPPTVHASSSSSSFTAVLRHRRKPKDIAAKASSIDEVPPAAASPPLHPQQSDYNSDVAQKPTHPNAHPRLQSAQSLPGQLRPATAGTAASAAATLGVAVSAAGAGGSSVGYGSFTPLISRLSRAASAAHTGAVSLGMASAPTSPAMRRPAVVGAAARSTAALDTVSEDTPPHVAVRYGDTIRLFAKSRYATASDTGGYVGTFDTPKRFLAPKSSSKQGELACIPPIRSAGTLLYRPSTFRIQSTCGLAVGSPVSYGDVVVLVDDYGRVWNNKIGVGPTTTKNGYFGPRDSNTPGEMFLSLYQLVDDDNTNNSSESDSDDDDDSFLSFSSFAKTTKSMAETTFGKPTQVELDLAAAAMRTIDRVVYYGDRNVVLDVADSNRIRSKFNRVITHYRKSDASLPVQGGYLRCDGRGKTILFELHGPPLPTIESIDVSDVSKEPSRTDDDDDRANGSSHTQTATPRLRLSLVGGGSSVKVGQAIRIENLRRSNTLSVCFSDGGIVQLACAALTTADNKRAFYRLVRGGMRPTRILVQLTRSKRRRMTVGFRETLQGTYKELAQLFGFVVVTYSCGAYVISHVVGADVLLPAMYVGIASALVVLVIEMFYPGKIVAARSSVSTTPAVAIAAAAALDATQSASDESIGDWEFTILALEASESEHVRSASVTPQRDAAARTSTRTPAVAVPRSFLVAENGNAVKAAERYAITLAWRQEVDADRILTTPQLHYDIIKANYTQFLHKHDKLGHPVYYEKMASINIKQLHKAGVTQDDLFRHYIFAMEFTLQYVANACCLCDACATSDTQKLCIILDARGIGMKDIGGEAFEFVRRCTSTMQKHYPQKSFKIFFVNVPSWFGMAWKGIKPLLNETTRAKTNIVSETDTPATLLDVIDAENLPVEYGGTCNCAGGCDEHSAHQELQRALVRSVLAREPFDACATALVGDHEHTPCCAADAAALRESDVGMECAVKPRTTADVEALRAMCLADDDDSDLLTRSIPPGSFRDEILKASFLLQRSLRHKHFNPIWRRRFFVLHPESLRFGKSPDSEIFQIVSFTRDTVVRKTAKQNNSFELITPLMASNGHSLLLYAPTLQLVTEWVDAINDAIAKLAPIPTLTPLRGMTPRHRSNQREGRSFWQKYPEKEELNQYWYSVETVDNLAAEVLTETPQGGRVAFLSTPSVYFTAKSKRESEKALTCILFDFDAKFATEGTNFVPFDFNAPEHIPLELHRTFDFVVIDPPFITKEVWQQYATAAKLLQRSESSKILLTTIEENAALIQRLLQCAPQAFKPSIPHLVYQYALYTNYTSQQLCSANPELE